ncbi:tetratricopeptide repeat protein [Maribacter sp. BPC-D8]|uniref:tetratricopeptide repeat protein n=1 Tax=Maribacter sp. BPC-D8 TaxID=3053613 RepID=UPI002B4705C7|nr:tetratricopeptide repeat protein [Maribacter sp. BPC-D8]WRI28587.1 tetratricopeptide repeat protein [Maribacter sp. BPC-D8]
MKKNYILTIILLIFIQLGFSQDYEIVKETKKLVDTRDIYLNGGTRSQFGGKSRTYIKFDLPPNTVHWYYSFATTKGQSGTANLNLAVQLTGMIADPSGITSNSLSAINVPEGIATADFYLLDHTNLQPFINKIDYQHYTEGMAENTKQAVVKVDDIKTGSWYLGIKNPSSLNGINLIVEIVAITETRILIAKSDKQQKAELYGGLGWTNFESGDYEKCIEYCDKANAEFELGWVLANKGLAELMTDKESNAMETYIQAITLIKKQPNPTYFFKEMIKDINNSKKIKPNLTGADEIKQLIEMQRE